MAARKTIKAQSRHKQAPEGEKIVAVFAPNGASATDQPTVKNGGSPSFEQIQRRAYELFLARGGAHGYDMADWLMAEQELTTSSAAAHQQTGQLRQ